MRWVSRLARFTIIIVTGSALLAMSVAALSPRAVDLVQANESTHIDFSLCQLAQRTAVFDRNGELLGELAGDENRVLIESLDEVSDEAVQTVLTVEDANFYEHSGINARAITRAFIRNVNVGGVEQGGSTITQQLIKSCILGPDRELVERKIPEAAMAMRLEDEMEKDEILVRYLNTVYFGGGAYGIKAASQLYSGVEPAQLDWAQSAMLASLISSPVGGDPTLHPEDATVRRDRALVRLLDDAHITEEEFQDLRTTPVPRERQKLFTIDDLEEDYFLEEVKQALLDDERLGASRAERTEAVFSGGLQVYTTLDPAAQAEAEQSVAEIVPEDPRAFTAALAAVEPGTGAVRALVGGPGFEEYSKFNLATQKGRPTGSSFKTFVLAAAMEQGHVPNDTVDGSGKCTFAIPNAPDYSAENFGGSGGGVGTIRSQTLKSSNCAYLRLGQIVGLGNVIDTAHALGVTSTLPEVLSLPLGPADITPLDMATAYATIANDGVRNDPYYIERVEDASGDLMWEHVDLGSRAISVESARLTVDVLEENVRSGTGTRARLSQQPAGGKTGTAQDFGDAWFVGFTPYLSTAVWMGNADARVPMRGVGNRSTVTGGSYPAMIWNQFMEAYHFLGGLPVLEFEQPEGTRSGDRLLMPNEKKKRSESTGPVSICGSSIYEIDSDGDGVADSCRERPFYGWCPSIMVPVDDDGDGSADRCVPKGDDPTPTTTQPPKPKPTTTNKPPPTTVKPKPKPTQPPPTTTKKPPPPTTTQQPPPTTQQPPPTTQPPPPTTV